MPLSEAHFLTRLETKIPISIPDKKGLVEISFSWLFRFAILASEAYFSTTRLDIKNDDYNER